MAYVTYNENELRHLEILADRGDTVAYEMIFSEAKRVAKAANIRLLRLEKAGYDDASNAYGRVRAYSRIENRNNIRFKVNKSMSVEDLADELREMRSFMAKETSTVRGNRYARDRIVNEFETLGVNIEKKNIDLFYDFLRTDTVQDVIDYYEEYYIVMEIINNNLDKIRDDYVGVMIEFEKALTHRESFDSFVNRMGLKYEEAQARFSRQSARRRRS